MRTVLQETVLQTALEEAKTSCADDRAAITREERRRAGDGIGAHGSATWPARGGGGLRAAAAGGADGGVVGADARSRRACRDGY